MLNFFQKNKQSKKVTQKINVNQNRGFRAALRTRFTDWITSSFTPINRTLKSDLRDVIVKSRDLALNNELFRSHINNMCKSIIGSEGFRLQSLIKDQSGVLNTEVNKEIENAFWDWSRGCSAAVSEDGLGAIDFDNLILRTFLVDGEVFIRINRSAKNKYGISFELLDSLCIDPIKNHKRTTGQNAIVCGVQIDQKNNPVQYWYKPGDEQNYNVGQHILIPANEMIHIYRKEFPGQVRGFSEICASLDSLKQLDDFAVAELLAAKIAACQGIFYQRNTQNLAGDVFDQQQAEENDQGQFETQVSPGSTSIVPQGYTVKSFTPNHPSSNFSGFVKAITRKIAASLGVSYNRLAHDYQSVNYSSLREASIDQEKFYSELQRFLIENWKQKQYCLWLKSYIINSVTTSLKPKDYQSYLDFQFIPRRDDYFDAAKDIIAVERKLALGLSNPIIEMQNRGLDVDFVLDGWVIWKKKLEQRGLSFEQGTKMAVDTMTHFNEEASDPEFNEQ